MSTLRFHTFDVTPQTFLQREHTIGIVNLKPIVPLHVLIIPLKQHARLSDVSVEELHELFETVQTVSSKVQELVGATSCTVSIQDGVDAGQSVPHLHVHILPRKKRDFVPKDEIYSHLEKFGLGLRSDLERLQAQKGLTGAPDASEDRKARSDEEMKREADWLREKMALSFE